MGIHVAVTGLNATDNPAPGVGVIRCLRHPDGWDGEIIGLGYDVYDTGLYDGGLLDHTYLIPYPNQGSDQVFDRLRYIHEQVRIDVLIPTLDSELSLYQQLAPRLKTLGIALYLPSREAVQQRSKVNLPRFCRAEGVDTPETVIIREPGQLEQAFKTIGFPLMLKGVFYEAYRCNSPDEARIHFVRLQQKWGLPVIAQEVVKGEEFDVCCLGGAEGELLGAVPIRKVGLTDKGKAWAAITLKNDELLAFARHVVQALRWSGPCELEIMKAERSGRLYLLEVNPRFPAWVYLCAGADQNLPRLLVDLALGKPVQALPPARSGMTFVRHATDLVCPLEYVESLTVAGELHYNRTEVSGPSDE
jgi:carbamoyl-phosphate synthase large subunit